ncbi:MAG TPA: dTDP-glucose 4,6-dehydratase [Actinomycetota bacterium]|nr:dTDP-glucose 4,6-dehydratase [Actinomycetota bacterium]
MRLLVTGGAGFIGSRFAHLAIARDHEVTVLDALTYAGTMTNLAGVKDHAGFRFVKGDICDPDLVDEVLPGHDAVLNFAAESHVDRSIASPENFMHTNFLGAGVLLESARRAGTGRFLQVSTDEVYGSIEIGSFAEADRLNPSNPYSAAKAGADLLALSYVRTFGMPVVITRSSNAFGPHQFPEKLIPLAITNLIEGKKIPLYGDGANVRDWTFVDDICEAILLVLERGETGRIYNIAAGNERRNVDVVEQICGLSSVGGDMIEPVADRPGHDRRYSIDASAVRDLGWRPSGTFDERLAETVAWYRDHRAWWEPLKARA